MRLAVALEQIDLMAPNYRLLYPLALMVAMWQTARERRQLGQLDDQQLADLGLSSADARKEALRPFWDLPQRQRQRIGES